MIEARVYFKNAHRLWGYNPYYLAGYPSGINQPISNHWAVLLNIILGPIFRQPFIFNLALLSAYLLLPIFVYLAAKNFSLSKINTVILMALSEFCIIEFRWLGNEIFVFGGYGWPLASFMSLHVCSLLYKYIVNRRFGHIASLAVFGSMTAFAHPAAPVICAVFCIPLLIFYFRELRLRDILYIGTSMAIIIFFNYVWIGPMLKFYYLKIDAPFITSILQTSKNTFLSTFRQETPVALMIVLSIFSALHMSFRRQDKRLILSLLVSLAIFLIFTFLGSQIGLGIIQPFRFIAPAFILMVLIVAESVGDFTKEKNVLYIICLAALFVSLAKSPMRIKYNFDINAPRGAWGELLDFIKNDTAGNGRLLLQDSERIRPYGFTHFPGIIPHATSKEMAGGPGWVIYKDFKFISFIDDTVFGGKSLKKISDADLKQYLELYNIKYILVYSDTARGFFGKNNAFRQIFRVGTYNIYEYLESKGSYCHEGTANVGADYDKIVVKNASPGTIILKYHYIDTLRIRPDWLKIGPVRLMDDPIPFIQVENGTCSDFIIYNDGLRDVEI
jgi:hypothetical protein